MIKKQIRSFVCHPSLQEATKWVVAFICSMLLFFLVTCTKVEFLVKVKKKLTAIT